MRALSEQTYHGQALHGRPIVCKPRLVYLPNFKSGVTTNADFLDAVCGGLRVTDRENNRIMVQGVGRGRNDGEDHDAVVCYTFVRNPMSRFFASYSEVSERDVNDKMNHSAKATHTQRGPWARATDIGTRILLLAQQMAFAGGRPDKHLMMQTDLLYVAMRQLNCRRIDFIGQIENATAALTYLARRAHSPFDSVDWGLHKRSEMDASYLRRHYMDTQAINATIRARLEPLVCRAYMEDFCALPYALPPACAAIASKAQCEAAGFVPVRTRITATYFTPSRLASWTPSWTRSPNHTHARRAL